LVKLPSIARRIRGTVEAFSNGHSTETVVCGKCGQRFALRRDVASLDVELAKKQVSFVTEQLVWDHIQERKHHGTIELPNV
jgi:transcription elongation factor Elf1